MPIWLEVRLDSSRRNERQGGYGFNLLRSRLTKPLRLERFSRRFLNSDLLIVRWTPAYFRGFSLGVRILGRRTKHALYPLLHLYMLDNLAMIWWCGYSARPSLPSIKYQFLNLGRLLYIQWWQTSVKSASKASSRIYPLVVTIKSTRQHRC